MKLFIAVLLLAASTFVVLGIINFRRHLESPLVSSAPRSNHAGSPDPANPTGINGPSSAVAPDITTNSAPMVPAKPQLQMRPPKMHRTSPALAINGAADRLALDAPPPAAAVPESEARAALDFVGLDPAAEKVWITAINDPSLPNESRQNLIEDLNENGISDPHHPTMQDLPLIQSRLALIEELAPDAMDDVNLAAFGEAYKDLNQMLQTLTH